MAHLYSFYDFHILYEFTTLPFFYYHIPGSIIYHFIYFILNNSQKFNNATLGALTRPYRYMYSTFSRDGALHGPTLILELLSFDRHNAGKSSLFPLPLTQDSPLFVFPHFPFLSSFSLFFFFSFWFSSHRIVFLFPSFFFVLSLVSGSFLSPSFLLLTI